MNSKPDFVGSWLFGSPEEGSFSGLVGGYGDFRMYVQKREQSPEGERIEGVIEDQYGHAEFKGTLLTDRIHFVKRYDQDAILRGAAPDEVIYDGQKRETHFTGGFIVRNGTVGGVRQDWSGKFYVMPYAVLESN